VRLSEDGQLEGLAAGSLKRFEAGPTTILLEQPIDLALWRTADGGYAGVLQDYDGPLPEPLRRFTDKWSRLAVPKPLAESVDE
jgi:hypothetical protein